jgi:outer membrane protein OmpA-like peptidoglycan-associated protein
MDNNRMSAGKLGYGGALEYQYFFSRNFGIATGVGIQRYNTNALYSNSFENSDSYKIPNFVDNDYLYVQADGNQGQPFEMRLRLSDWKEKQQASFLEVPLMLMYQTKWGQKQRSGIYFGIGAKIQLPIMDKQYSVTNNSQLSVLGYYDQYWLTLGDPYNVEPRFGTIDNTGYKGEMDLKMSIAGTGELGFLIGLSRRVDLTLGGYIDYGFNNIQKADRSQNIITPASLQLTDNGIGSSLEYNGIVNSGVTDRINLFSFGIKLGIRVKLGALEEEVQEKQQEEELVVEDEQEEKQEEQKVEEAPVIIIEQPVLDEEGLNQAEMMILSEQIFFDLGKYDLKAAAIMTLDRKAEILHKYPDIHVQILGNTCDLGGDRINIPLGQDRAEAACDYLERKGISRDRMTTVTQADTHSIVPNTNEENRTKNRRADFVPTEY